MNNIKTIKRPEPGALEINGKRIAYDYNGIAWASRKDLDAQETRCVLDFIKALEKEAQQDNVAEREVKYCEEM